MTAANQPTDQHPAGWESVTTDDPTSPEFPTTLAPHEVTDEDRRQFDGLVAFGRQPGQSYEDAITRTYEFCLTVDVDTPDVFEAIVADARARLTNPTTGQNAD